jgi:uncharacterized membrane protein
VIRVLLVSASIAWPLMLGGALWQRIHRQNPVWTSAVYVASSTVCHRLPARSFHSAGVQWPVCARCSGLYLAAPFGALLALATRRRRRTLDGRANATLVGIAAAPAAISLALEWLGVYDIGNVSRFLTAIPIGVAVMLVLVRVVDMLSDHGAVAQSREDRIHLS